MIKVFAPATSANLRVGFDALGLALEPVNGYRLGDFVTIEASDAIQFATEGKFVSKLPTAIEDNLCYKAYQLFEQSLASKGQAIAPFKLTLNKNMPVGSGLGSSSTSVVASLVALNEFAGKPLCDNELLELMGTLEGSVSSSVHYDNVAPCFLGGMQLILANNKQISAKLPSFKDWYWVIAYSGISVSTAAARQALPATYPKATTIQHASNLATFIHACYTQDQHLAKSVMTDLIAEPYREPLLVNYDLTRAKLIDAGAQVVGISGSGPTIFAIADNLEQAERYEQIMREHYFVNEEAFSFICRENAQGAIKVD